VGHTTNFTNDSE
jgi:hypothetical protein